ncbi:MAG: DNA-binding winged helix-turn-helix (wHTH) protein/TolB-like protein [Cryomorphaceae bacterium]|jgi:DNA-binding winged helix-turn-helix (wHTH) protein/TolB-like protein/Tfp pilus assembly protein PilF
MAEAFIAMNTKYRFNNTELDSEKFILLVNGHEQSVEPQVFNLIVYLIQNKDKVVSRDELLEHIWQGRVVSDTSINNNIKSARKVLGDDGTKQQVIKTIHSRGYQFVARINADAASTTANKSKTSSSRNLILSLIAAAVIILMYFDYHQQSEQAHNEQKTASPSARTPTTPVVKNKEITAQKIVAVLPFANNKPNVDSDYLGFALANQIISDLSYLEKYAIRPAGSIRKYVDQIIDPIAIGRTLQANYVISGNYLLENDIIRLNVEMIEVTSNHLVWRESMQVNYSDTFSLQDMVAQKVAKGLGVNFKQNALNQPHRDIPSSALAFEYYLRGISYPQSNEGHKLAVAMLQKSVELDPQYAPSYAYLGLHRRLLEQHGRVVPTGSNKAEWYYQKALELNPVQLEALSNLSALYVETNRIEDALQITRRMLEIDPDDANSHFSLGYIYRYAGMLDEAITAMETALKISPNNMRFRSIISTYISAGRYEEALAKVYLDPGDYGTGYSGIIAYEREQYGAAKALFRQVIEIDKNGIWGLIAQVHLAVMDDNKKLGMLALTTMVDSNITDAENMYYFAHFYALFKEKELCLEWLEKAVNMGYFNYPYISQNGAFNFIQHDERYISILEQAQHRHQTFRRKFL